MTNESTSEGTVRVDATVRAMTGPEIRRAMRGDRPVLVQPEEPLPQTPAKVKPAVVAGPPPLPPAPWTVVGPVIPLDDDAPGAETTLAGAPGRAQPTALPGGYPIAAAPGWRRLVDGLPIDPPAGRVDDIVRRAP